jgi:uncharacterized protein Usg
MTLEERIEEFTNKVYNLYGKNPMTQNFIEYWTEHNEGAKKCRFEFEKVFVDKKQKVKQKVKRQKND